MHVPVVAKKHWMEGSLPIGEATASRYDFVFHVQCVVWVAGERVAYVMRGCGVDMVLYSTVVLWYRVIVSLSRAQGCCLFLICVGVCSCFRCLTSASLFVFCGPRPCRTHEVMVYLFVCLRPTLL